MQFRIHAVWTASRWTSSARSTARRSCRAAMAFTPRRRPSIAPTRPAPWARAGRRDAAVTRDTTSWSSSWPSAEHPAPPADSVAWTELLPPTRLQPDTRHVFSLPGGNQAVAALKLEAFPDGGLSRVRLLGPVDPGARRLAGYRWFNALPERQAADVLAEAGVPPHQVAKILSRRPLTDAWRDSVGEPMTSPGLAEFAAQLEGGVRA